MLAPAGSDAFAMELARWHAWWKAQGRNELHHLLLLWWDPLEVRHVPQAQSEYNGYSGRLARLLREGASTTEVAAFLSGVEGHMGLDPNDALDRLVAEKVLAWYTEAMAAA